MLCEAQTAKGEPCRAPAQEGRAFCFHHDPQRAQERTEARRRGGLRSHGLDPDAPAPEVRLRLVSDVLDLLEMAGSDILRQQPSLARARALAYVAGTVLKVLEVGELEERVKALEERHA